MSRRVSAFVSFLVALLVTGAVFALGRAGQVRQVYAIVAAQAIPQDTPISASWVKQVVIPETAVQQGMVGSLGQVVGRYAALPMAAGDYVESADVEGLPLRDGLCTGQVGFTVAISSASQAVGIYPGMYVNVVHATAGNTQSSSLRVGNAFGEPGLIAAGVRVVAVENSAGGLITGPTYANQQAGVSGLTLSGSNAPAMVELAIPVGDQSAFASAISSGGVSMSPAPWLAPSNAKAVCPPSEQVPTAGSTPGPGVVQPSSVNPSGVGNSGRVPVVSGNTQPPPAGPKSGAVSGVRGSTATTKKG